MNLGAVWDLLKEIFSEWSEDKAARLAAALAYYITFSLAPLLLIVIAIVGLLFGQEAVQGRVVEQIQGLVGPDGAQLVQTMLQSTRQSGSNIVATLIGIVTLLLGATGVFVQLQDALNTIWEVAPKPGRGVLGMVKDRLLSFTMLLGIGFLLLVSLAVSAGLAALSSFLGDLLPGLFEVAKVLDFVISLGVITLLFAMIYKFLPDVKIRWGDVWVGAAVTSLLFTVGKFLIGLYLGYSSAASVYGAAGSLAVLLIWIYYTAQIVLLGAEFTQVYAKRYGSRIVPGADAVFTSDEMRAQQGMPRAEERQRAAEQAR
jgi:membrane protein